MSESLTPALVATAKRDCQYASILSAFYAMLGDKESALEWLENSVNRGFINYPYLSEYDPFLASLRSEPRFEKLMQRVKREWEEFEV